MNPQEVVLNDAYRKQKVDSLLTMAKMLASDKCMAVHIESIIGNPGRSNEHSLECGSCLVCRNDKQFLMVIKEGAKSVLFDLFIFGDHAIQERVLLKTLVDAIKNYPRVCERLISGSRM